MAEPISIQQLKDASEDAISLAEFIYKPASAMVKRRLAPDMHTLDFYTNLFENLVNGRVRAQDVSTVDGSNQEAKNTEFRNELDALPFEGGVLADTFLTVGGITNQRSINMGLESIQELQALAKPNSRLRVYVNSYHAGKGVGGGVFVYDASKASENDGGVVINGWVRQGITDTLSFEMFGTLGDGITDDRPAISKAMLIASRKKLKLVASPNTVYLLDSFDYVENVKLIFRSWDYMDMDLNGSTLKLADNIGDYFYVFHVTNHHQLFRLCNGKIDQNTKNNPSTEAIVGSTLNTRVLVGNHSMAGGKFIVNNMEFLDVLGVWQTLLGEFEEFEFCNNTIISSEVVADKHDTTSVYTLAGKNNIHNNRFIGDFRGNAVTAIELHGSNNFVHSNYIEGYVSSIFVVGDNAAKATTVIENTHIYNNKFIRVGNGIVLWLESGVADKNILDTYITNNRIHLDSRRNTTVAVPTSTLLGVAIGTLKYEWVNQKVINLQITGNDISIKHHPEMDSTLDRNRGLIDLTSSYRPSSYIMDSILIKDNVFTGYRHTAIFLGYTGTAAQNKEMRNFKIVDNTFSGNAAFSDVIFNKITNITNSLVSGNTYSNSVKPIDVTTLGSSNVGTGLVIRESFLSDKASVYDCDFNNAYVDCYGILREYVRLDIKARKGSVIHIDGMVFENVGSYSAPYWIVNYHSNAVDAKTYHSSGSRVTDVGSDKVMRVAQAGYGIAKEWVASTAYTEGEIIHSEGLLLKAGSTNTSGTTKPVIVGDAISVHDGNMWWVRYLPAVITTSK